jgi:hypothetical protein
VVLIGFLFAILSFYLYSLRNAGSKSKDWKTSNSDSENS